MIYGASPRRPWSSASRGGPDHDSSYTSGNLSSSSGYSPGTALVSSWVTVGSPPVVGEPGRIVAEPSGGQGHAALGSCVCGRAMDDPGREEDGVAGLDIEPDDLVGTVRPAPLGLDVGHRLALEVFGPSSLAVERLRRKVGVPAVRAPHELERAVAHLAAGGRDPRRHDLLPAERPVRNVLVPRRRRGREGLLDQQVVEVEAHPRGAGERRRHRRDGRLEHEVPDHRRVLPAVPGGEQAVLGRARVGVGDPRARIVELALGVLQDPLHPIARPRRPGPSRPRLWRKRSSSPAISPLTSMSAADGTRQNNVRQ